MHLLPLTNMSTEKLIICKKWNKEQLNSENACYCNVKKEKPNRLICNSYKAKLHSILVSRLLVLRNIFVHRLLQIPFNVECNQMSAIAPPGLGSIVSAAWLVWW